MKKIILTSATVLFIALTAFTQDGTQSKKWYISESDAGTGFSQDLSFEVRGRYSHPVKKEKLNEAKLLSDFIPGYPANWVTNYVSVEILATSNDKTLTAVSTNESLTTKQRDILNSSDLGTEIVVSVKYKHENAATGNTDIHEMRISMMVIPEIEAEFIGGYRQLKKYLKENIINKISETTQDFQQGIVVFTVNEEGEIVNAKISKTSGDPQTDKFLVKSINKMPKWRPAENSMGIKVKQEFVFSVGSSGC